MRIDIARTSICNTSNGRSSKRRRNNTLSIADYLRKDIGTVCVLPLEWAAAGFNLGSSSSLRLTSVHDSSAIVFVVGDGLLASVSLAKLLSTSLTGCELDGDVISSEQQLCVNQNVVIYEFFENILPNILFFFNKYDNSRNVWQTPTILLRLG